MRESLPMVAVFGASDRHLGGLSESAPEQLPGILDRAGDFGRLLADLPVHLLTGGGGGVMRAVCEGFTSRPDRQGQCIGILPGPSPRAGYPNEFVEIPIRTHLPGQNPLAPTSRNHVNVLTADLIVAFAGGPGTAAELQLATEYGKEFLLCLADQERINGHPADFWPKAFASPDPKQVLAELSSRLESLRRARSGT